MPGSLLTPHDALSDRSEASYGSTDSRASAKKVSFNKAVRVKQYPWTPDDNYGPEDGNTHLSLPSRRFWFKVYKVKSQQVHNGDHWRDQNGGTHNGHYSQPRLANNWEDDNAEDTYDSLAPIVEDDGTDHDDRNHMHSNGLPLADKQQNFQRNHVKDIVSKFNDDTYVPFRRENGMSDAHGYIKHGHPPDSSVQTTTKHPMIDGFKAVLAKSQAKLKGEKKDTSSRNTPQKGKNYRATSPHKQSGVSNSNYITNMNSEKSTEVNDKSVLPIKIPRAESPRRDRDNIERFSLRYKMHQRRSRSTDDTPHKETGGRPLMISDKSVSTDDLDSFGYHSKSVLSSIDRANKDKSTQCNGTLIRSKPLTAYGTPRLSRSSISNLVKREEPSDKKSHVAPQNGNFKVKTDAPVNNGRSYSLNGRPTDEGNHRSGRSASQFESSVRNIPSNPKSNVNPIITKPRIAMNSYRSQSNKGSAATPSKEIYTSREVKSQDATKSNSGDRSGGFAEVKSTGLYERGRGLSVVHEERYASRQHWNSTPLTERRASSWERSIRPTAATVGYQSGRCYVTSQRLRGGDGLVNNFETSRAGSGAAPPPKAKERNRLMTSARDANRSSPLYTTEMTQNNQVISSAANSLKNGFVPATGMIDWSLSGFQLGPPTVDRGLASDSECLVHQRPPLLMYIPGVSHHEKPALEEDRMSGMSGISRADMDDDLRPLNGVTNSYVFNRRNSMPKDCNKSWVKWKVGGKPSRQP